MTRIELSIVVCSAFVEELRLAISIRTDGHAPLGAQDECLVQSLLTVMGSSEHVWLIIPLDHCQFNPRIALHM